MIGDPFQVPAIKPEPEANESPPTESALPPCKWYIKTTDTQCGKPAPHTIKVRDLTADAQIEVCTHHKTIHRQRAIELRTKGQKSRKIDPGYQRAS